MTPTVFWGNTELLLETVGEELPGLIERLLGEMKGEVIKDEVVVMPTRNIYLGVGVRTPNKGFDLIINCK